MHRSSPAARKSAMLAVVWCAASSCGDWTGHQGMQQEITKAIVA